MEAYSLLLSTLCLHTDASWLILAYDPSIPQVKPVTSAWTAASCPRGVLSVAAGFGCSGCVTLTSSGDTELYTWGSNDYGVLGQGPNAPELVPQPTQVRVLCVQNSGSGFA